MQEANRSQGLHDTTALFVRYLVVDPKTYVSSFITLFRIQGRSYLNNYL